MTKKGTKTPTTVTPKVTGDDLTRALNTPATIDDILKKRKELGELSATIGVYLGMGLSPNAVAEINYLQERLEFRITQFEDQLLGEKIDIYKQVLAIARKDKSNG